MKKMGVAALAAMSLMGAFAGTASAGPPDVADPCADIRDLFTTAYIYVEPLPEPVGSTVGTAYQAVCKVTG